MNSSNNRVKNLSATIEATTQEDPNGTADSRTDARRSPYFRDYRKEQERRGSTDTAGTTTLVTRLAGLLWAIVDQATADSSARDTDVATELDMQIQRASRSGRPRRPTSERERNPSTDCTASLPTVTLSFPSEASS